MSDHSVIAGLTETLQALFEAAITHDAAPDLNGVLVDLRSPRDMRLDNEAVGLSVWLYRVDPVTSQRGMLPPRAPAAEAPHRGLAVEAHLLFTPLAKEPGQEHTLLGRVLETLRDQPVLSGGDLRGALAGGQFEVRLTLETLTLAESTELWRAMQEPYRLAVAGQARLVEVEA